MDSSEELREALLDLEESRKREKHERKISEAILAGLHAIAGSTDPDELFHELLDVLRELLAFESAFVLRENSDGTLTATVSSDPSYFETHWQPQAMFERIFAGQPVAVYDTGLVDEWRSQPHLVTRSARSAIHFAIRASKPRMLFVCTHSEPAHFSHHHVALARRFTALIRQALQKIESDSKITDLEEAEKQIRHLNLVLRAVRNVNQLITQEKDRDRLLQGACATLTEDRGYFNAWIALFEGAQGVTATFESGLGASFKPMAERLMRGDLTHCVEVTLTQEGVAFTKDPSTSCGDCPLSGLYSGRGGLSVRLEHEGRVYGILSANIPVEFSPGEEEQSLFKEVADDIAFALHSMEVEKLSEVAELALRDKEKKLSEIIEGSSIATFVIDANHVVTHWNRACENTLGIAAKEMIGSGETWRAMYPQERPVLANLIVDHASEEDFCRYNYAKVRRSDALEGAYEAEGFFPGLGGNGKWFHFTAAPLRDSREKIIGAIETIQDITERRQAEEALRESEIKYRTLVEHLPSVTYSAALDECSSTVYISPQIGEILGISSEDYEGDPDFWVKYLHEEDRERVLAEVGHAHETGLDFDSEYRMIDTDGGVVWIHDRAVIVRNDKGEPLYLQGSMVDIRARRQAEEENAKLQEQLRQSQKMEGIGRLAGGIAHDFNNMMTVVTGYGELLRRRFERDDPRLRQLDEMIKAGKRATVLTQQLLAFSRKQILKPEILDLNKAYASIENMLRRLIGEDVDLVSVPCLDLGMVNADRGQVDQVIMNLAVNARDAMPKGGRLTVETANVVLDEDYAGRHVGVKAGSYVMMAMTDSGHGMDEETQAKIFEPFYTTKEPGRGTGLGLSTVYGIMKQSGGNVWVYSEPGKGTTFKIYLPRVEFEAPGESRPGERRTAVRGEETILLVEDDDAVRAVVMAMLEGSGYTILKACCGTEALRMCEEDEGEIDLLLSDVIMPGMSGRELADQIRAFAPSMRVLFMSGYTDSAIHHHGVLDPGCAFIEKPFSTSSLTRKVRNVLDGVEEG